MVHHTMSTVTNLPIPYHYHSGLTRALTTILRTPVPSSPCSRNYTSVDEHRRPASVDDNTKEGVGHDCHWIARNLVGSLAYRR